MTTATRLLGLLAALALASAATLAQAAPQLQISPLSYQLTQLQPVPGNPRALDVTSRVGVVNVGDRALDVKAHLVSTSSNFIVLDGDVSFGDVPRTPQWKPTMSRDTFQLRVILPPHRDLRQLLQLLTSLHESLVWTVSCADCGANRPPVASAGADQTVYVAQLVTLDGSASSDPDGQPLTYAWSFVSRPPGSAASLSGATSVNPSFTPDREGDYVLRLLVTDGRLTSAPDTVQVSTLNSAPVANAGRDSTAVVGKPVALDGSASSDVDGDSLTYAWAVASRPTGSTAGIVNPSDVHASFTPDLVGQYLIELIVDDGTVSSAPDTMMIDTARSNTAPVADAGADRSARVGDTAQLDGSASSDVDGDPLTYRWSLNTRPPNSAADLQGAMTSAPTLTVDKPGTYVAQLIVRDGQLDSDPDTVSVSTVNSRPTAVAGADQTVQLNTTAHFDGSASVDPDGDALGFTWSILSRPDGSTALLSDANAIAPTLTADAPGLYIVQLIVSDGVAESEPDTAVVSALAPLAITTESELPRLVRTAPASVRVHAVGGSGTDYTWRIVSGALPAGLSIASSGTPETTIAGTPTVGGTFGFTVQVTDSVGGTATRAFTVSVDGQSQESLDIFGATLPNAVEGEPYDATITASGGTGAGYAWTVVSGALPAGLTLRASGTPSTTLSGTATEHGTFNFTVQVSDSSGNTAAEAFALDVTGIAPPELPFLSIDDVSVVEGDAGTTNVALVIRLSAPSANGTSVNYATADADASSPEDYAAASGTAHIEAGSTSTAISVTINGDTRAEADETLSVRLSNAVNATIGDAEGIVEIVNDDAGAPTTFELIDAALASGAIDDETALLYKVFAEFGDPRLPQQYVGRSDPFFEGVATMYAARHLNSFSPATRAILAPFFEFPDLFALPLSTLSAPAGRRSVARAAVVNSTPVTESPSYRVLELVPGRVRMGWDDNSPLAIVLEQHARALEAEFRSVIWPKLTRALGPLIGGRILILLDDAPGPTGEDASIDCATARIRLRQHDAVTLAHELTHALLDLNFTLAACNQDGKLWMHEATAQWAQHYVYPPANQGREQGAAPWFLRETDAPLNKYERGPRGHQYGAYLWFFRLAGQGNDPSIVRAMWESALDDTGLEGIDGVLRASGFGGFEDQWPKFALDNWNREAPYHKYYEWDGLSHKASQHEFEARLDGEGWRALPLGYDLPILSADYQRWDFTKDPNIRGILFQNTSAGDDPNASIRAIVKIRNQPWREAEDWSQKKERFFCRDNSDEDVEEVILVVANRGFQPANLRIHDQGFQLIYSATPCSDWTGSTTYRQNNAATSGFITSAEGESLRFRPDLTNPLGIWRAIEGTITVHINDSFPYEDGTCVETATKSYDAKDHGHFALLWLGGNTLQFTGGEDSLQPPLTITVTTVCTSSSGTLTFVNDNEFFHTKWFETGPIPWPIGFGATTIADGYSIIDSEQDERWTWQFEKVQ